MRVESRCCSLTTSQGRRRLGDRDLEGVVECPDPHAHPEGLPPGVGEGSARKLDVLTCNHSTNPRSDKQKIRFETQRDIAAPTSECPGHAGVELHGLTSDVHIHQGFGDALAIVHHFQLCDFLPPFLFDWEQKCRVITGK